MKYLIVLFLAATSILFAQELNCTVTVNLQSIPPSTRDNLSGFQSTVQNYMNQTKFTDGWQGNKIRCSFTILLLSASNNVNYTAQIIVSSQRDIYKSNNSSLMLTINDNNWSFIYEKNQSLITDFSNFDPLTSLLNYYAYVIIGYDMDSWEEFGGTDYYSKAYDIVNLAASSSANKVGWEKNSNSYSRRGLVDDLLNDKFRPFREAFYQYHYGIDYYEQNKSNGQKYIVKAINILNTLRSKIDLSSVIMKVFFDAKNGEIIERLKDYPNKKEVFETLKKIDPAHSAKYDAAMSS